MENVTLTKTRRQPGQSRTRWIGTSWKMNKTLAEARDFAETVSAFVPSLDDQIQAFVIPSFTAIRDVKQMLAQTRIKVGAQNMHWEDAGAWTGEISPLMLKDCGVDLVELGHSERREHFGETDRTVGLKTAAAVRHGLIPLICVGETLAQRDAGRVKEVLSAQVEGALAFLTEAEREASILFAYEPVWAIGASGTPASADYANSRQAEIAVLAGSILSRAPPVLYGGSVSAGNAAELIAQPHVDGLFIGRSAWRAEGFLDILAIVAGEIRN
jgi:L-erythrulose 1-phosphate isomerase